MLIEMKIFMKYLKKYNDEEIDLTGLFYKSEKSNKIVNRFHSRIIFPINNLTNDPIAFGGRIISGDKIAKYINSPETEFYKKGKILFNLDRARNFRVKGDENCSRRLHGCYKLV